MDPTPQQNQTDAIQVLDETGRWRARDVKYWAGRWERLKGEIPSFTTDAFRVGEDAPSNPYLRSIIRLPRTAFEKPIPVGVVSNSYTLAPHVEVAEKCFEGIRSAGIKTDGLECQLGLTELGEWMNLRVYFPDRFSHTPYDGKTIRLRLECVNSVDGSSRLVILLSWLRVVCSNGMVIRETKTELRDIHNERLNLEKIPSVVSDSMQVVENDLRRLKGWERAAVNAEGIESWVNTTLAKAWGKKAACRVYHICTSGHDVELADQFAGGEPTEKPVVQTRRVPGAPASAKNLFDVSQALSWVATQRNNTEERLDWQTAIPELIRALAA
jgi:hypothetical protein